MQYIAYKIYAKYAKYAKYMTLPWHEKVTEGRWLDPRRPGSESDGPSSHQTLPAALPKDQYVLDRVKRENAEIFVHKDYEDKVYEGLLLLCCYATEFQEGCPHYCYAP